MHVVCRRVASVADQSPLAPHEYVLLQLLQNVFYILNTQDSALLDYKEQACRDWDQD